MKNAFLLAFLAAAVPSVMAQTTPPPAGMTPQEAKKAETYFHFSMGRVLDQQEEWEESIKEYKKALESAPNDSGIYSAMARTYLGQRNRDEAIKAAQKAIELNANNLGAHRLLANIYLGMIQAAEGRQTSRAVVRDSFDKAIREYEEIIRIDPKDRDGYLVLGELYRLSDAPDKSIEVYQKLLAMEPGSEGGIMAVAQLSLDANRFADAIQILRGFLKDQPQSFQALEMLGDAYAGIGDISAAADAYRRAVAISSDADLRDKLAETLFEDAQLEEAAKLYEAILQEDQTNVPVLQRLGQIYRRQMKYTQAREILRRALGRSGSGSVSLRFDLALVDRDEGKFEDAVKAFESLLKDTEKSNYNQRERQSRALFFTQLGAIHSLLTRFDDAITAFNNVRSLSEFGERSRVDLMIADTYREARNSDKALSTLQAAMQEYPNNKAVMMAYADLLAERQRTEEGLQVLQRLAGDQEPDLDLLRAMAGIYERAEKFSEAQRLLDSAKQRFPDDMQVHFLQGALYEKQRNYSQAEQAFRKALDLDRGNPSVLNYLGYMLADRDLNLEEALAMIKKAVDSDPINGAFLDSLGWVYFKLNKLDLAEQFLKRAVTFAATNATMHDHLGDLYYKTARYSEAEASWTKGLQYAEEAEEAAQIRKKLDQIRTQGPR